MDIIVSDFDGVLFKRNYGLINPVVEYLEQRGLPVYIVTYRAEDQLDFIAMTLAETNLYIAGYGFAGSRKKDPITKGLVIKEIIKKHNIIEALDDELEVVVHLKSLGINARTV